MVRLILFAFMAQLFIDLPAQYEDLYIHGFIRDAITGDPLPGCIVEVQQDRGGFVKQVPVNEKGEFLWDVSARPQGIPRYTLVLQMDGYVPLEWRIDATGLSPIKDPLHGWVISYDVLLKPGNGRHEQNKCVFKGKNAAFTCTGMPAERIWSGYKNKVVAFLHWEKLDPLADIEGLNIYGYVRDHWTRDRITGAEVIIQEEGVEEEVSVLRTDAFGFYAYPLQYDKVYQLIFRHEGMVSKTITLDMDHIPQADRFAGFGANVDVRLFPPIPGEDLSFLDEPMGRMSYNSELENMEWDMSITRPVLERLDTILKRSRER